MTRNLHIGLVLSALCFGISFSGLAQQKKLSLEDAVLNTKLNPVQLKQLQWLPKTDRFIYVEEIKGTDYLLSGTPDKTVIDTLAKAADFPGNIKKLPLLQWVNDTAFVWTAKGKLMHYGLRSKKAVEAADLGKDAENEDVNANGTAIAFTKDNNLFIARAGGAVKAVTSESNPGIVSGKTVHRSEFGIHKGTFWSPKGTKLAFYRMDESMVTDYPLVDISTEPAHEKAVKYPMAGGKSHHVTLGVYNLETEKTTWIQTGEPAEQYLTNIAWSPDEKLILTAVLNRGQNHMKMNSYDAQSGAFIKTLFEEKDDKFVEPTHTPEFLSEPAASVKGGAVKPSKFIWQSRRDGFNNLYLYDTDGTLLKQLTALREDITDFHGSDPKGENVFYTVAVNKALSRKAFIHNLKSNKALLLTPAEGTHTFKPSPSGKYMLDFLSSITVAGQVILNRTDGKPTVRTLFTASEPLAEYAMPKTELLTVQTDGYDLNARIITPPDFNPIKKYPVLVYLYAGPHVQLVSNSRLGGANLWMNYMAQKGYIVFTIDSRGSDNRGRDFENATFRKLGTIEAEDQMRGLKWLKGRPYVDSNRVGIHGWSFGGFMTTTMMTRYPKAFRAGVAGGPVTDWGLYEVMYTERYMDTPQENPVGYSDANLMNHVKDLSGRLMMIHGTADDVVVWQHSQRFVKKCVDEGKLLDYFIYPGHEHNVRGKDRLHLMRTITRYFDDFL
ncbi:MAG: DPP IV N-terminal domain-containing protein [Bacteroidota bacterium]